MPESFNKDGSDQDPISSNTDPLSQGTSFGQDGNPSASGVGVGLSTEQVETLVKRDLHAQEHIKKLETEALESKTKFEEYQAKLDQANNVEQLLKDKENTQVNSEDLVDQTASKVAELFQKQDKEKNRTSNWEKVQTTLSDKFGDKTDEIVKSFCTDNGYSWDEAIELAKTKPNMLLKLCGADAKQSVPPGTPAAGGVNTQGFEQQNAQNQQPQRKSVMELRSDRERVDNFTERLAAKLKEIK